MEVTTNNSTTFAPKLGSVSQGTASSDAFSSHLREATPNPRARSEDRNPQNDDRSATNDRAEAADDRRETRAREADADAREENREQSDADAGETDTTDSQTDEAGLQTEINDIIALNGETTGEQDDTTEAEATSQFAEQLSQLADGSDAEANADQTVTLASQHKQGSDDDALITTDTTQADEQTVISGNGTTEAAAALNDKAVNETRTANAATIASSESLDASANKPVATSASTHQNNPNATTNAEGVLSEATEDRGLPNPLGQNADGEADTGGQSEKGLGQQAAESLANRNDASDAAQKNTSKPAISAQASASTLSPIQIQAIASLGLNATALPADIDIDLLGLNTNGLTTNGTSPQNTNATLVRFGSLPGQAQATQVPNTAIALQIAKHVAKGVSTFEIRIDPPEMGRIDVKLELAQDGRVTAHLAVEKSETLDLMQRDAKALEQALKDAGLDVDSDTLNFSLKDGSANDNFAAGSNGTGDTNTDDPDYSINNADDASITTLAARQINAAARGGVDVSI